jgi:DNA polymerase III epsilon subunit-like protein
MQYNKNLIFYDLETNGLDYYTTGIMQLTMIDINGNILLNQYSYPFDGRIDGTHIHGIDKQKLIDNNAIQTMELCILVKNIIRSKYHREDVYLIAYNNFGYDQIILENNYKKSNIKIPNNWYFIDVYPIVKELYPNIKPNYKLSTVYEVLNQNDNNNSINYHCALQDTICLYEIYKKIINTNTNMNIDNKNIFSKYTRSLLQSDKINISPIYSLNGTHKSMLFEDKNIYTIGDIYNIYKMNNFKDDEFQYYLKNKLFIYSNFYINNILKQLNVIHYLQTE